MSSPFSEQPSDDEIQDENGTDPRETSRDQFEVAIAHTGLSSVQTTLEREAVSEISMTPSDLEKAKQDKVSDSSREVEISSGQDVPDKSGEGDLLDVKEDEDRYPSGIRLLFLTLGLMAVVLMVALDNYILGLLPIISLLRTQMCIMLIKVASDRNSQDIHRTSQLK